MSDDARPDVGAWRVASLAAAVRQRHPDGTSHLSDDALGVFVREGIAAAATLGLTDEAEALRFMCLPLVLSPPQRRSLMIQSLATRVLDRTEWDGRKRLDFIYRHLVPRTPSLESEVYLRPLFDTGAEDQAR
jgi:hypothetical protein